MDAGNYLKLWLSNNYVPAIILLSNRFRFDGDAAIDSTSDYQHASVDGLGVQRLACHRASVL